MFPSILTPNSPLEQNPDLDGLDPWRDGRDHWPERYRLTHYAFPDGGFEVSVSVVDMEKARDRDVANNYGFGKPPKAREESPDGPSEKSLAVARRRARSEVRRRCRGIGVTHLLTLTTRAKVTDFEELKKRWAVFTRLYYRATGKRLEYICVPERHPTNPGHMHLHAAVTSYIPVALIRRLWYIALGGKGDERGKDTPGNVDMQQIKVQRASRRSVRIGSYISKYLTKSPVEEFNKKRYFCSRGAGESYQKKSYWLDANPDDPWPRSESLHGEMEARFPQISVAKRGDYFVFEDGGRCTGLYYRYIPGDNSCVVTEVHVRFPDGSLIHVSHDPPQ
ncbi:MAG: hypothetical protein WBC93_22675 [Sulfitobacter sp.]